MPLVDTNIENRLLALLADATPRRRVDAITRATHLRRDLGLDSIGILSLVFQFEREFEVNIAGTNVHLNMSRLRTAGDLIETAKTVLAAATIGSD